ncbi:MAG TPA: class A beta-lactamase [Steroidobacteraceae bacterium]
MEGRKLSRSLTRREVVALGALSLSGSVPAAPRLSKTLPTALTQLEKTNGGRLGVAVLDTATSERSGYREREHFPMCSTFKFLLASAVLQRVDRHDEALDRAIAIPPQPLLSHSPISEAHAGSTMTIAALCAAILTDSDNTAANALLDTIGGPAGVTRFCRSIGDAETRLDRVELALNESLAGDLRDTTTPASMVRDLQVLLLGTLLSQGSRARLTASMEGCRTGLDRLRAKVPAGWRAADRTGSNGVHTSNDIAVLWPPGRPPVIVAAYITGCPGPESKRLAMLAEIGSLVASL